MYKEFIGSLEYAAGAALDGVAGLLNYGKGGMAPPPSDGTIILPDDLFAQTDAQTEWWYYTGHCKTKTGREFGFELVFFKRRTDSDRIGVVPLTALANPMYFAHFAISDITVGKFCYEHKRSFGTPLEASVKMSADAYDISFGDWSIREIAGSHILHATFDDGTVFDAILRSEKPPVPNGDNGDGLSKKKDGTSKHFSFTRMSAQGQLTTAAGIDTFGGSAWMDREYGAWEQGGGWDWFSIQFDDNSELMIYQFQDETGTMQGKSTGTFVAADGSCTYLIRKDFEIEPLTYWTSEKTEATYPASWTVRVPLLDINVEVASLIGDQELDTRGSTMVVYWEGACSVIGTRGGRDVRGRAYVELVGYDRSHESVGLIDFLFGGVR